MDTGCRSLFIAIMPPSPRRPRKRGNSKANSSSRTSRVQENELLANSNRSGSSTARFSATDGCDRRLSRAAREIVRQHLLTAISKSTRIDKTAGPSGSDGFIGIVDGNHTDWNVWQLFELVFPERTNITTTCSTLMDPSRDVGRPHEEQSLVISYNQARKQAGIRLTASSSSGKALRSSAIPGMVHASKVGQVPSTKADLDAMSLHQCGFCGKIFLSRYYLDQHFDRRHSNASISASPASDATHHVNSKESLPTSQELVCPADAWCHNLLSRVACHEMALLLEPFYGPGSNGRGPDRRSVHRQWQRLVPACRTNELQQASQTCHSLLQCIPSDASPSSSENGDESKIPERACALQQHFVANLCREQTCQDLLHQSILGNKQRGYVSQNWHVDEWYQAFQTVEANHHRLGLGSVLLLLAIAIYYGSFYCYDWMFAPSSRRAGPRLGLLREQNSAGTSTASRRPTTTSGARITGRKQRPLLTSAPRPNTFVDVGPAKRKQN